MICTFLLKLEQKKLNENVQITNSLIINHGDTNAYGTPALNPFYSFVGNFTELIDEKCNPMFFFLLTFKYSIQYYFTFKKCTYNLLAQQFTE